jgi:hypothetical protein
MSIFIVLVYHASSAGMMIPNVASVITVTVFRLYRVSMPSTTHVEMLEFKIGDQSRLFGPFFAGLTTILGQSGPITPRTISRVSANSIWV